MNTNLSDREYIDAGRAFLNLVLSSVSVNFAAAKPAKPKQCSKGFACKQACISKSLECRVPLQGQAKTYAGWLDLQLQAGAKLSKSQQEDADNLGLNKKPSAAAASRFELSAVVTSIDKQQEDALNEWKAHSKSVLKDKTIPTELKLRSQRAKELGDLSHLSVQTDSQKGEYRALIDKNGVTQSMALVSVNSLDGGSLYVKYLATAPWNITGTDPRRTKGAGTEMIKTLVEESAKRGFDGRITLEALPDSVEFYKKLGFVKSGSDEMTLSAQAAHKLLYGDTPPPPSATSSVTKKQSVAPTPKGADPFPSDDLLIKALASNKKEELELHTLNAYADGGGGIFRVTVDNKDYFAKRPLDPLSAQAESASYELAKSLGMEDDVLPVKVINAGDKAFVVSPFVSITDINGGSTFNPKIEPNSMSREEALRLLTFDYIAGNSDRNIGNIASVNGKIKLIDNEFTLGNSSDADLGLKYNRDRLVDDPIPAWLKNNAADSPQLIDKQVASKAISSLKETVSMLESKGLPTKGYKKRIKVLKELFESNLDEPTFDDLFQRMGPGNYS